MKVSDRLDATFLALADPTRRAVLARLARGEASVAELAEPFSISQPAISKHLKILERARLISVGQAGQRRPRRIEPKALADASLWLERYREMWDMRFERLDSLLGELQGKPAPQVEERAKEPEPRTRASSRPAARPRRRRRRGSG